MNFGHIDLLDVQAPIQTNGPGARGFNVYDGSLREAGFASIATHGDGSVGVQVVLKAIALTLKPGGHIGSATIAGKVSTAGATVTAVELDGAIESLSVAGDGQGHRQYPR